MESKVRKIMQLEYNYNFELLVCLDLIKPFYNSWSNEESGRYFWTSSWSFMQ